MNNNQNENEKSKDFFEQRLIVWTNINYMNSSIYRRLKGLTCICQDARLINILARNYKKLAYLHECMNVDLEQPIIAIDCIGGTDNQEIDDYYIITDGNLRHCFDFNGNGLKEWYTDDKGDLRSFGIISGEHCFTVYRMLKSTLSPREVEKLKDSIICGCCDWDMIENNTEAIGQFVEEHYPDDDYWSED